MTAASPRTSVLIPAFNAADHVAGAIASALDQTMVDLEVLVIDDGSTDGTAHAIERCAALDRRVRLLRTDVNLGPGGARNLGLAAACGEWIALLDSDDRFLPGRLEGLLRLADERDADMVADNLLLCGTGDGPGEVMMPPDMLPAPRLVGAADYLEGNLPIRGRPRVSFGFLKPMIRRAFLQAHHLRYDEDLRFAEDFAFILRALLQGAVFWLTSQANYEYRIRPDSLTSRHDALDLQRLRLVEQRLLNSRELEVMPAVRAALRRHARSIDDRLCWRLFTDALKRRDYGAAATIAIGSPGDATHIVRETVTALPRVMRRLGRRLQAR